MLTVYKAARHDKGRYYSAYTTGDSCLEYKIGETITSETPLFICQNDQLARLYREAGAPWLVILEGTTTQAFNFCDESMLMLSATLTHHFDLVQAFWRDMKVYTMQDMNERWETKTAYPSYNMWGCYDFTPTRVLI